MNPFDVANTLFYYDTSMAKNTDSGLGLIVILIIVGAIILTAGGMVALPAVRQVWEKGAMETSKVETEQSTQPDEAIQTIPQGYSREIVEVKFVEGSGVRLRGGKFVSLSGQDLSQLHSILSQYPVLKTERLFTLPEEKLEEMKKPGTSDLNLWYQITLKKGAKTEDFINALNNLAIIELAEPAPLPAPPPSE